MRSRQKTGLPSGPFLDLCTAPVEEDLFLFYSQIAISAAQLEMSVPNPEMYGVTVFDDESGTAARYNFTDNAMNRMMVGLKENMSEEQQDTIMPPIMTRMLAVMPLLKDKRLAQWVVRDVEKGYTRISDAVFKAAAAATVNNDLQFDMDDFQQILAEKGKEEEQ